ncbi:hypothetical protein HDV05_001938 [Chytridiales sp. JEL 0842]|nr:hypothetical protein HDV05_001938 [Chytridiales sp. JEL 0842]
MAGKPGLEVDGVIADDYYADDDLDWLNAADPSSTASASTHPFHAELASTPIPPNAPPYYHTYHQHYPPRAPPPRQSGPTTPVSAAWLGVGVWAKGMGKRSVGLLTNIGRRATSSSSSSLSTLDEHTGSASEETISNRSSTPDDDDDGSSEDTPIKEHVANLDRLHDNFDHSHRHAPPSCDRLDAFDSRHVLSSPAATDSKSVNVGGNIARSPNLVTPPRGMNDLPPELLFKVLDQLPTATLTSLLTTPPPLSAVSASTLSSRVHSIRTLEDLRAFTHDDPNPPPPVTLVDHTCKPSPAAMYPPKKFQMKEKQLVKKPLATNLHSLRPASIGPLFYRAGTMILFARHFTRLIPEAKALLGLGYAFVLAWFMCLFYALPFFGALTLYFAMDIVDAISRTITIIIQSLPRNVRAAILPKSHTLHPDFPHGPPRVPASLIRLLHFAASAPASSPTEPTRCCGPAGAAWNDEQGDEEYPDSHHPSSGLRSRSNTGRSTTPEIPTSTPSSHNPHSNSDTNKNNGAWGLMSPYTPWHLYLLTYSLSRNPNLRKLTLSRVSLAWWFRLHPVETLQVLVLNRCEVDETGVGLVAKAFFGLRGLVVRGSEVRGGGWDVEGIRRPSASIVPVTNNNSNTNDAAVTGVSEDPTIPPPEESSTTTSFTASSESLSSTSTDFTTTTVSRRPSTAVEEQSPDPQTFKGWFTTPYPVTFHPNGSAVAGHPPTYIFPHLRIVRFEMCAASCALDAIRMVLDRCPAVERIEFVGCGMEETQFLESLEGCLVEYEVDRLNPAWKELVVGKEKMDLKGVEVQGLRAGLWWEAKNDAVDCIERTIERTRVEGLRKKRVEKEGEDGQEEEVAGLVNVAGSDAAVPPAAKEPKVVPAGVRKCIVVHGEGLKGLRNKWYIHLTARQRNLWEGHP